MNNQKLLEKIVMAFGTAVVVGGIWFWALQVGDVLEVLEMAYG